jgi:RNase P/RNase MRP subunit p29
MKNSILKGEFIGKHVKVDEIKGKIIDETKNLLIIKDNNGKTRKLIKKNHTFTIKIKDKEHQIKGEDINTRPEERIRMMKK